MMSYPNWLYTSVGYEIYPRSFYDSNQDGVGDIRGIIEKIDNRADGRDNKEKF